MMYQVSSAFSKQRLALISDPSFARSYILNANPLALASPSSSSSHLRHPPWTILYAHMYTHRFSAAPSYHMRFDNFLQSSADDCQFPSLPVMFPPGLPREDFCISVSSNGLLLCRWQKEVYFVANPLTRRWVSLPRNTCLFAKVSEGFVTKLDECEIAVTNFKVVRLDRLSHASGVFSLEIFSSKIGEWTDSVLQCPLPFQLLESGGPIVYNGVPHWPTRRDRMVAYDPYCVSNPCRLLKSPEERDMETEAVEGGLYRLCDVCQAAKILLRWLKFGLIPVSMCGCSKTTKQESGVSSRELD